MWNKQKQQKSSFMSNKLTNLLSFKLDFQNVDQHTGDKCLIYATKDVCKFVNNNSLLIFDENCYIVI